MPAVTPVSDSVRGDGEAETNAAAAVAAAERVSIEKARAIMCV